MSDPRNQGHGHVVPRPDGVRARCGGPALCRVCQAERAALESAPQALQPPQGAEPDYSELSREGLERHAKRLWQAMETAHAFWHKHALGPLAAPSCLCCGKLPDEVAIRHMELPGVVICKTCRDAALAAPTQGAAHADDIAVDRFAASMKAKLARKRAEGRGGWDHRTECTSERLAEMLIEHIPKGDPVDIANFAMMIHQRDAQGIENQTIDNLPDGVKIIAFVASQVDPAERWQAGYQQATWDMQRAAPPQGASSLLPTDDVDALIDAAMEVIGQHDAWARQMPAGEFDDPLADAITKLHKATETVGIARDIAAASPLPAPQEPLQVFSKGPWLFEETGQRFTGKELDEAAFAKYAPLCAAPAPVDPESQGSSEPRLSDRDLIDRFDL